MLRRTSTVKPASTADGSIGAIRCVGHVRTRTGRRSSVSADRDFFAKLYRQYPNNCRRPLSRQWIIFRHRMQVSVARFQRQRGYWYSLPGFQRRTFRLRHQPFTRTKNHRPQATSQPVVAFIEIHTWFAVAHTAPGGLFIASALYGQATVRNGSGASLS